MDGPSVVGAPSQGQEIVTSVQVSTRKIKVLIGWNRRLPACLPACRLTALLSTHSALCPLFTLPPFTPVLLLAVYLPWCKTRPEARLSLTSLTSPYGSVVC